MWKMFQVIPIMWRAVRPSRVADMPAVVNPFWLRKGFEGLTFFGKILTPTQALADEFNTGFTALKNHEMIHLRQAQSCGDSWLRQPQTETRRLSAQPLRDGSLSPHAQPRLPCQRRSQRMAKVRQNVNQRKNHAI